MTDQANKDLLKRVTETLTGENDKLRQIIAERDDEILRIRIELDVSRGVNEILMESIDRVPRGIKYGQLKMKRSGDLEVE